MPTCRTFRQIYDHFNLTCTSPYFGNSNISTRKCTGELINIWPRLFYLSYLEVAIHSRGCLDANISFAISCARSELGLTRSENFELTQLFTQN